ncbi:UDP-2,4-diacetamido-2,4,6-trideoxy-beta-L-altropyranose hydrolase [Lusitaniella coriacea]|uniref:UDP-2,4-diacetamido-2,4, 6-trideoxy-beta-L-altropyranose hydrolase n=1 Tax=Lusitaniella coriacea TaxID=1983105 RepID=UPI003CF8A6DA
MSDRANPILIRTDASPQIGTGHLMRCLALAQAHQETGGCTIFAMARKPPALVERLKLDAMEIVPLSVIPGSSEEAKTTASLAQELGCNGVVVDGYHFSAEYQKILTKFGLNLLFIDDCGHASHYYANWILNQNIHANETLYQSRESYTQLLLGTRYTLLRREFRQWQGWQRETIQKASKILVTLGGGDPDNVTGKVIQALQQIGSEMLEVIVVVGGANPHYEQLQFYCQELRFPVRLVRNVTNMPELMAWADIAVTAGGSTCWELAFMGLPSLILIVAENQRAIAQKLEEVKVGVNLGWHENIGIEEIASAIVQLLEKVYIRTKMSQLGRELVDGRGAFRVLSNLE